MAEEDISAGDGEAGSGGRSAARATPATSVAQQATGPSTARDEVRPRPSLWRRHLADAASSATSGCRLSEWHECWWHQAGITAMMLQHFVHAVPLI